MTVDECCEKIRVLLETEVNEQRILDTLDSSLVELRGVFRADRSMFEESSIEFLAGAKAALGYVRDFVELLEERPWVSTADDAHDLALKIADCADRLGSSAVTQRCRKEAKELCELAKQLPAASEVRWTAAQARRIADLEAHAPLCPACRAKMRVRESKHGLFWGCRNFPSCFGKRSIERSEAESLW